VLGRFDVHAQSKNHLYTLGRRIRERRKALRVSAVVTAETAEISRVTLHRIEKGEPSVSMGAYYSVATALGLAIDIQVASLAQDASQEQTIPVRIKLADYPQLRLLAWHIPGAEELSPLEAFALYENNQRHIDKQTLEPHEKRLIEALGRALTDRY
jgi:transcriptional regulator with XRE-family HTH domain